jgi:uracil-DNA glycosylase family 4
MSCLNCRLYDEGNRCSTVCLKGSGSKTSPLVVILDHPCRTSDYKKTPLQSKGGDLFDHVLQALGLDRSQLYLTYMIKCRPTSGKWGETRDIKPKELLALVKDCRHHLDSELAEIKPKVVLLLGGNALLGMTGLAGITKWEGAEVTKVNDIRAFCGYSPAYVLKNPGKEVRLAQALYVSAKAAGLKVKPQRQERIYPYEIF